jgi:hypothetical protein
MLRTEIFEILSLGLHNFDVILAALFGKLRKINSNHCSISCQDLRLDRIRELLFRLMTSHLYRMGDNQGHTRLLELE